MGVPTFWNKNTSCSGSKENRATGSFSPFIFFLSGMLQSQKYLQVFNSLKCPSNRPIKLAALQKKWCLPSTITPLVSPAQEITRFQASKNEIIGIILLLSSFKHNGAVTWTRTVWPQTWDKFITRNNPQRILKVGFSVKRCLGFLFF